MTTSRFDCFIDRCADRCLSQCTLLSHLRYSRLVEIGVIAQLRKATKLAHQVNN